MTITDAKQKLYDQTFFLGQFWRRGAIATLAKSVDPADVVLLAEALIAGHPNLTTIMAALLRLSAERDAAQVAALWLTWGRTHHQLIARIVAQLGLPAVQALEVKTTRDILTLASASTVPEILHAMVVFVRSLPLDDELWNDAIYVAWMRSQYAELEHLITEQQRQPGNPILEALHALVTGQVARYRALPDEDGALLMQAFAMAPATFRDRMAQTIAHDPDRRMKEIYRRALFSSNINETRLIENLKLIGDDDGLFEKISTLRLGIVLELCDYWSNHPGRPSRPNSRIVVEQALTAYRSLTKFRIFKPSTIPKLPSGLVDIFEEWRSQAPDPDELALDLQAQDPFRKARALYLGRKHGLINQQYIDDVAYSEHWIERLVARLIDPATLAKSKMDHVLWVALCTGEGTLLQIPIAGTPEDFHHHGELLMRAPEVTTRLLFEILCAFQEAFVASGICVDDINDAIESSALEIEDAEEF